MEFPAAI